MKNWLKSFFKYIRNLRKSYSPEMYYMRGPGPAWQSKHPGQK